ncbi:MAG: hypothetical protein D6712_13855 [Chloroflexi bacterium]|nr:MAG: hypothetical protein D6712_13855 [Chloroflexota bacterium]
MRMYVADGSRKPSAQEVFIMAQLARDGYVEIGATVLSLQEDGSVKTCCGEHFSSALDAALVYAQRGHE